MLKENWRFVTRIERFGDLAIILLSFFVAYHGRSALVYWNEIFGLNLPFEGESLLPLKDYFIILALALVAYGLFLEFLGGYSSMRLSTSFRILRISVVVSLLVFMTLAAFLFILKIDLSRSFIGLFCTLTGLGITAERYVALAVLRFWRKRGMNFRNVIICGVGHQAIRLAKQIVARPELGIRIRGVADLREKNSARLLELKEFKRDLKETGVYKVGRIISGVKTLEVALKEYAIDEVIFTDIAMVMAEVEETVLIASEQGVETTLAADLFSLGMVKSGLSYFGDMPLIHFQTPPGDQWELIVKRAIDVAVSGILLLVLAPVFLLIAALVRATSEGSIFFVQTRVGLNGHLFNFYKFRSMQLNAEKKLLELVDKNEMNGPIFKMSKDPRVTKVGAFLRRWSLDELPQLWNVLIGDMSLVGPRPPIPGEVSLYERRDRRRLSMRPGLTCTWQVSGRNKIKDFETWVKMDLEYIDNWTLSHDFVLLAKTVPAVFLGDGAH